MGLSLVGSKRIQYNINVRGEGVYDRLKEVIEKDNQSSKALKGVKHMFISHVLRDVMSKCFPDATPFKYPHTDSPVVELELGEDGLEYILKCSREWYFDEVFVVKDDVITMGVYDEFPSYVSLTVHKSV